MKNSIIFNRDKYLKKLVFFSSLLFLLLSSISRLDISFLQTSWPIKSQLIILVYLPLCLLIPYYFLKKDKKNNVLYVSPTNNSIDFIFLGLYLFFIIQCLINTPPLFSGNANFARLDWGVKYVHVLTEIYFRFKVLVILGRSTVKQKISSSDLIIISCILMYCVLVVSRSFLLEIMLYIIIYIIFTRNIKPHHIFKLSYYLIILLFVFIYFGDLRQGVDFDISDYGEAKGDYGALIWFFGYFLVNFDNLSLIIENNFTNDATSNIFGSLLQTLQITEFKNVDEYLYVGKFNLGTAFRPYILDFGSIFGGLTFTVMWYFFLKQCYIVKNLSSFYSILFLLIYIGVTIPLTSRIEQPPYLFVLILLRLNDYHYRIKPRSKPI